MKNLKLFEAWSEDYTLDFSDHGFELSEVGQRLNGRYKGNFLISDLNTWYAELIDRLNGEWEVTQSNHNFNSTTGNATFQIEIMDKESGSISVMDNGKEVEVFPYSVPYFSRYRHIIRNDMQKVKELYKEYLLSNNLDPEINYFDNITLTVKSKDSTGKSKEIYIGYYATMDSVLKNPKNPYTFVFSLGRKSRGISMSKEQIEKLLNYCDKSIVIDRDKYDEIKAILIDKIEKL